MKVLDYFGQELTLELSYGVLNTSINCFTNCSSRRKKKGGGKAINMLILQLLTFCNAFLADRSKKAYFLIANFTAFIKS